MIGDRGVARGRALLAGRSAGCRRLGSWVVRKVSNTEVPDTTSGFRALTREAALRLNIVSEFTYTLESIIQAGKKRLAIAHLPIEAQETRPSRLFGSTFEYVKRSGATIVRIYAMYEPFKRLHHAGLGCCSWAASASACATRTSGGRARCAATCSRPSSPCCC